MAEETYLVTGGCGFIGSHIVEKLLQKYPSARVAVLSRNPTTNTFPRATYHAGDIASADDVTRIVNEAASDKMTLEYDDPNGMRTCTLRPAAVHGERDNDITPNLMRNYRLGRNKVQLGDNSNLFSTTYVGNAADAHIAASDKLLTAPEGVAGEAFFITNGPPMKFWDFSRTMWKAAGDETKIEDVKVVSLNMALAHAWAMEWFYWFKGEVSPLNRTIVRFACMSRWYVIDKAKERLGWEPAVGNEEGIRRAVEWFLENEKKQRVKESTRTDCNDDKDIDNGGDDTGTIKKHNKQKHEEKWTA
ncbi:Sterol-4-alpha-carboxylate 3-dehydrogenase, decarboxylating [Colletotrichum sp. SAR 10_99]|nr:Sterol-4-alpha-carboxylate 3-dehydrogenase, decarboxylating [Colletotrichum sp. SAR 10_96]KAJ5015412.1 Sterol-4-alpha-carboxylate 3-dehydrogenase, decarboxylating [Colletotrichum sp. SAR 10_99]